MAHNQVTITRSSKEGRFGIQAPYSAYFVQKVKQLGGNHAWNGNNSTWYLDMSVYEAAMYLVEDAYCASDSQNDGRAVIENKVTGETTHHNILTPQTVESRLDLMVEAIENSDDNPGVWS